MRDWWILVRRGEVRGSPAAALYCAAAVLARRFRSWPGREWLSRSLRGPAFVLAGSVALMALAAALSGGFAVTRSLLQTARDLHHALPGAPPDPRENLLVACAVPVAFAFAAALASLAAEGCPVSRYGLRYWAFLAWKAVAIAALLSVGWIEGGTAVRVHAANPAVRVWVGGIGLALAFVVSFGCALRWAFADQRRRCPVCLRRLSMPVAVGSWASMFEPAATELLCGEGHGALALAESAAAGRDRWTTLDSSWSELFTK
jgi:hypothetical protein